MPPGNFLRIKITKSSKVAFSEKPTSFFEYPKNAGNIV
jgi:hypothetical protein